MIACVLVVVEEPSARRRVADALEQRGWDAVDVGSVDAAPARLGGVAPDVIVSEAGAVDDVRATALGRHPVPVLSLGRSRSADASLELPLNRRQLLDRVEGLLGARRPVLVLRDRTVDLHTGEISGQSTTLTTRERDLVAALAARRGRVVRSEELVAAVWGHAGASTLSVTLRRVRHKLERDPSEPAHLRTVHGVGVELLLDVDPPVRDLPRPATPLVGRTAELGRLVEAIEAGHGALTVHGPAGVGKTRLALELGQVRSRAGERVRLCDLGAVTTDGGICQVVAEALQVPLSGSAPGAQLALALAASGPGLWILDNADAALQPLTRSLAAWRSAGVRATFVITSRQAPDLSGAYVLRVDPLTSTEARELLGACAPTLDAADVAQLADTLDGLPLALELAAGVAVHLGVGPLLDRWSRRFELLGRDDPGGPERRTLEQAIASSWERLPADARGALVRLTPFSGALPVGDAVAITGGPAVLQRIVRASMVQRTGDSVALLDAIRAFVRGRASPVELAAAREGHRAWVLDRPNLDEAAEDALIAVEGALRDGQLEPALAILRALKPVLRTGGSQSLFESLLNDALERGGGGGLRGWALVERAVRRLPDGDAALPDLEEAAAIATTLEDPDLEALALARRGDAHHYAGRPAQAREAFAAATARCGERRVRSTPVVWFRRAHFEVFTGADPDEAERWILEALDLARPDPWLRMNVSLLLAHFLDHAGRGAEATAAYRECLRAARHSGDRVSLARFLVNIGGSYAQLGRAETSDRYLNEALALRRALGLERGAGVLWGNLAELAALRGELLEAEQLLDRAREAFDAAGDPRGLALVRINRAALRVREGRWTEADDLLDRADAALLAGGAGRWRSPVLLQRGIAQAGRGSLAAAADVLDDAERMATRDLESRTMVAARVWRARVDRLQGRDVDPARLVRAASDAAAAGTRRGEVRARAFLASLLAAEDPSAAARELEGAHHTWEETQDPCARALLDLADRRAHGRPLRPLPVTAAGTGGERITTTEVQLDASW